MGGKSAVGCLRCSLPSGWQKPQRQKPAGLARLIFQANTHHQTLPYP